MFDFFETQKHAHTLTNVIMPDQFYRANSYILMSCVCFVIIDSYLQIVAQ